jgi:hypothetical protein
MVNQKESVLIFIAVLLVNFAACNEGKNIFQYFIQGSLTKKEGSVQLTSLYLLNQGSLNKKEGSVHLTSVY